MFNVRSICCDCFRQEQWRGSAAARMVQFGQQEKCIDSSPDAAEHIVSVFICVWMCVWRV